MAKKIMQFRYYGDVAEQNKNQPLDIKKQSLASGEVFADYLPIVQLGIQTIPGTKFYLNNGTSPIIVGSTGIYELDLDGISTITHLAFDAKSLAALDNNLSGYLIIDIICDDVEG